MLTQRIDTIGEMSCNPSFGGVGKGTLVREIDALDGLMARVVDDAGIHFRILNRSKGPAVQGPRAQADRDLYKQFMLERLRALPGLVIHEDSAQDLLIAGEDHAPAARAAANEAVRAVSAFQAVDRPSGHGPGAEAPDVVGVVTGRGVVIRARKVCVVCASASARPRCIPRLCRCCCRW